MIRRSTISLNFSNKNKLEKLNTIFEEYQRVVNYFIDYIWSKNVFHGSFLSSTNHCSTWFSARMIQCAAKQALSICKSQRRKRKKTKPSFNKFSMELDQRFYDIEFDKNSFDIWLKFSSIGDKMILWCPSKKHNHFNKFYEDESWNLKKSCRLRKTDKGIFCDIFFQKEDPKKRIKGRRIGLDVGYKKLVVSSDGLSFGKEIEEKCNKIANKQRNSNNYRKAIVEKNEYINKSVKDFFEKYDNLKEIKIERLKNLKHKSKFSRTFNNKFQYWSYSNFISRLKLTSEELGVQVTEVDPAYTSQTCSSCSHVDKSSRNREMFNCTYCNIILDADHNAALNIFFKFRL
ncbi:MAG: transposase [Proteobacteria bacterium]|nr:transposase [Pseudomonadota bacterium]